MSESAAKPRYQVSSLEPRYRIIDNERGAVVATRKTIQGALKLATKLNACRPQEPRRLVMEYPATHTVRMVGTSRSKAYASSRGRHVFYGYCTCGAGTTNSASRNSVLRKLAAHARGDDRGIVR